MITLLFTLQIWLIHGTCESPTLQISNYVDSETELPEASDIVQVGNFYYLVMDDYCFLGKVSIDSGEISTIEPEEGCSGKSDHEALFRLPGDADDTNPTFIVCGEDSLFCNKFTVSDSSYVTVEYEITDGGEGCHDGVRWGRNKGIEGAVGFEGEDGEIYMLALIEGTGMIITYMLQEDIWISQNCVKVPERMRDYSSLAYYSTPEGTVFAVTSQKGRKLWIGMANGISEDGKLVGPSAFSLEEGTAYDFPKAYKGVEGVFIQNYDSATGNMEGVLASDNQAGTGPFANAVHRFTLDCGYVLTRVHLPKMLNIDLEESQKPNSQLQSVSSEFLSANFSNWSLLCGVVGVAGFLLGFGLTLFVKAHTPQTIAKCEVATSSLPQFGAVLLPSNSDNA